MTDGHNFQTWNWKQNPENTIFLNIPILQNKIIYMPVYSLGNLAETGEL